MSSDERLWDDTIGPDDLESAMAWQPKPPAPLEEEEEPWQPADYFFDEAKLSCRFAGRPYAAWLYWSMQV